MCLFQMLIKNVKRTLATPLLGTFRENWLACDDHAFYSNWNRSSGSSFCCYCKVMTKHFNHFTFPLLKVLSETSDEVKSFIGDENDQSIDFYHYVQHINAFAHELENIISVYTCQFLLLPKRMNSWCCYILGTQKKLLSLLATFSPKKASSLCMTHILVRWTDGRGKVNLRTSVLYKNAVVEGNCHKLKSQQRILRLLLAKKAQGQSCFSQQQQQPSLLPGIIYAAHSRYRGPH